METYREKLFKTSAFGGYRVYMLVKAIFSWIRAATVSTVSTTGLAQLDRMERNIGFGG